MISSCDYAWYFFPNILRSVLNCKLVVAIAEKKMYGKYYQANNFVVSLELAHSSFIT